MLSYPKLFHNLKAAVKEVCTGDKNRHIYYEDVRIPGEEMRKIVEDRDLESFRTVCGSQEKKHTRHFFIQETGSSVM